MSSVLAFVPRYKQHFRTRIVAVPHFKLRSRICTAVQLIFPNQERRSASLSAPFSYLYNGTNIISEPGSSQCLIPTSVLAFVPRYKSHFRIRIGGGLDYEVRSRICTAVQTSFPNQDRRSASVRRRSRTGTAVENWLPVIHTQGSQISRIVGAVLAFQLKFMELSAPFSHYNGNLKKCIAPTHAR